MNQGLQIFELSAVVQAYRAEVLRLLGENERLTPPAPPPESPAEAKKPGFGYGSSKDCDDPNGGPCGCGGQHPVTP